MNVNSIGTTMYTNMTSFLKPAISTKANSVNPKDVQLVANEDNAENFAIPHEKFRAHHNGSVGSKLDVYM